MLRRLLLSSRPYYTYTRYCSIITLSRCMPSTKLTQNQTRITSFLLRQKMSTAVSGYKLKEIDGDLFSAPDSYALAHCVAADMGMGAGVAVRFKQLYGRVDELRRQGIKTGGVATLKDKDRYIYYLVTKPASMGRPTYDTLHGSLCAMRQHMRDNNVQRLAIPRIGCGIDGLEWDKVSAQLNDVFKDENLEIVVYNYVPK